MKRNLRVGERYALSKHQPKLLYRYISLLAVIMSMCLYAVKQVSAQQAEPAATAVANIEPLQIGDTIPEYLWHLPLQVVNHPEGKEAITLNEYRGKKLIVFDFWSTWCSTCIAGMPKMFRLGEDLKQDVGVVPITYQKTDNIVSFIANNPVIAQIPDFFSVTGDEVWRTLFNISGLPNAVIVDHERRVLAIVRPRYITRDKLSMLIEHPGAAVFPKTRSMEDIEARTLLTPTFGTKSLHRPVYYSAVLSNMPGLVAHDLLKVDSANGTIRYFIAQKELMDLYAMAVDTTNIGFDRFVNRRVFQAGAFESFIPLIKRYEIKGTARLDWERQYLFNYEYIGPLGPSKNRLTAKLLDDLNRFFNLDARIEKRTVNCFILEKLDGVPRPESGEKEYRLVTKLITKLNDKKYGLPPVLDGTGETKWTQISLPADIEGAKAVNDALEPYGLKLTPVTQKLDMFILGRPGFNPPEPLTYKLTKCGYIDR